MRSEVTKDSRFKPADDFSFKKNNEIKKIKSIHDKLIKDR